MDSIFLSYAAKNVCLAWLSCMTQCSCEKPNFYSQLFTNQNKKTSVSSVKWEWIPNNSQQQLQIFCKNILQAEC